MLEFVMLKRENKYPVAIRVKGPVSGEPQIHMLFYNQDKTLVQIFPWLMLTKPKHWIFQYHIERIDLLFDRWLTNENIELIYE